MGWGWGISQYLLLIAGEQWVQSKHHLSCVQPRRHRYVSRAQLLGWHAPSVEGAAEQWGICPPVLTTVLWLQVEQLLMVSTQWEDAADDPWRCQAPMPSRMLRRFSRACPEVQATCLSSFLGLWLILEFMGVIFLSILLPLGWQCVPSLLLTLDLPAVPTKMGATYLGI